LQEEIQRNIIRFFYPKAIPLDKIDIKFHAGGREDVDVRMLRGGRPFVLEFVNPRKSLGELSIKEILQQI
jgi:tRNA U54 and U55 pseudouridine synthase Pus10